MRSNFESLKIKKRQIEETLLKIRKSDKNSHNYGGNFLLKMKQTKCGKLAETSFGERGGASDKLRFFVKKSKQKALLRRRVAGVKINGKR